MPRWNRRSFRASGKRAVIDVPRFAPADGAAIAANLLLPAGIAAPA